MPVYDAANLLNREEFFVCLRECVERHAANQAQLGLIVIKIQRLRRINTLLGYQAGDEILQHITQRLMEVKRNKDLLAKIGDTEFAFLISGVKGEGHAQLAANKILSVLQQDYVINDAPVNIDLAMGISIFPEHALNAEGLLQGAELATKEAMKTHQGYHFFSGVTGEQELDWDIEAELTKAIANNDFELYYQPKVNIQTKQLYGAEALIRWIHPEHGFVPVERFINLAELTGQILPITDWIINTAMRQACDWNELHGCGDLRISINMPPKVLRENDLCEYVESAFNIWGIDPRRVIFEVTESGVMSDPEITFDVLCRLQALGSGVSIDDFGTGYSSLAYFKTLPANELKIDKSFVDKLLTDPQDQKLVQAIIGLAREFEFSIVAEGVEDEQTLIMLNKMGCDIIQGYYFSRPLPHAEFMKWMEKYDPQNYWLSEGKRGRRD